MQEGRENSLEMKVREWHSCYSMLAVKEIMDYLGPALHQLIHNLYAAARMQTYTQLTIFHRG